MKITMIGPDLAKSVFRVHGVDERGHRVLNKSLKRAKVLRFFANLAPCCIGVEACGGAPYWARQLERFGHAVKPMAPRLVKPCVKTNKNDAADAEAIREAVARPPRRFVPIKAPERQAVLALHRARQGFVKARTAQAHRIRGLLTERGTVIAQGIGHVAKGRPAILEDGENGLPGVLRELLQRPGERLKTPDRQAGELDTQIQRWHRERVASRKLAAIPGIGPLAASAPVATIGDARQLENGRPLAAWSGPVPEQRSSGGKPALPGIGKRGDTRLRAPPIRGARAVIRVAARQPSRAESRLARLLGRRNRNAAAVAPADKNARIVWAPLAHDRQFRPDHIPAAAGG